MSLFRSNTGGLSINTGAANSAAPELTLRAAFGQAYTNRASASAHTPAAGTLFGSSTAAAPAATTPASTAAATTTPPTSTTGAMSLFGNAASKPAGGGLFGSSTAATGTTGAGALFGNAAASQPQQQTATTTAAGGGGGLFGAATTTQQTPASITGTTGAGGLFGNAAASQPQQQPATTATGGGGLFGAASNQAKPAAGGLFGASTANTSTQQPSATTGGGLFGQSQAQPAQGGLFGQTQTQQPAQQAAPQASVPAVQINYDNLRPRSRFDDLAKPVQDEIALIDKGIARVIKMRDEIGEFMPQHESDIEQLGRDVKFVESKFRTVQVALNRDIQTVKVLQDMTRKNIADAQLSFKATDNLKLPTHYHQTGLFATGQASTGPGASGPRTPGDGSSTSADAQDLITYFNRICDDVEKYKRRLDEYRGDIERDMPGVESGLYEQIRALRERHQGGGAGGNGGDGGMHDQLGQVLQALRETGTAIINQAGQIADTRERVSRLQAGILDSGVYAMGMTG